MGRGIANSLMGLKTRLLKSISHSEQQPIGFSHSSGSCNLVKQSYSNLEKLLNTVPWTGISDHFPTARLSALRDGCLEYKTCQAKSSVLFGSNKFNNIEKVFILFFFSLSSTSSAHCLLLLTMLCLLLMHPCFLSCYSVCM